MTERQLVFAPGLMVSRELLPPSNPHFRLELADEDAAVRRGHRPAKRSDPALGQPEQFVKGGVKLLLDIVVAKKLGADPGWVAALPGAETLYRSLSTPKDRCRSRSRLARRSRK